MDDQQTQQDENKELSELKEQIAELEIKFSDCEGKAAEYENNWKRALADYRNLQKRTEEEKESIVYYVNSLLFKRIVPVLDNLEMLQKHLDDVGLKMIVKEFKQILAEEGVSEIPVQDQDFDPQTMEAIETVDGPENKVVEVLAKGYMLKNKLLRPARVKVGKQKEDAQSAD